MLFNVDRIYDYNCHENSSLEITLRKDNTCTVIQDLTITKVSYRNTMKITYEGCLCERVRVESHAINLVRLIKYVAPTNLHGRIDGCTMNVHGGVGGCIASLESSGQRARVEDEVGRCVKQK